MGGKEQVFIEQQLNLHVFHIGQINMRYESAVQLYGNLMYLNLIFF